MTQNRTVALVGRPNVGKSRLFNRLAKRRIAIVHDQAGVTRDVNSIVVDHDYTLLDTGGIGLVVDMDHQKLIGAAEEQVWFAVEAADFICFVVDGREGKTPLDEIISERLRASGKPVQLIVNKVDGPDEEHRAIEFAELGLGEGITVSAEHGRGESNVRQVIADNLGPKPVIEDIEEAEHRIATAVVGRPNVGKSSLINKFLENDRLIVSEVPGTTRDAISLDLDYMRAGGEVWPFKLIDTAGVRHRGKVSNSVEYFSTVRSRRAIEHAEIVLLVLDAEIGVTRADKALAGEILEQGKCLIIVINKWDIAAKRFREQPVDGYESLHDFQKDFEASVRKEFFFLPASPVVFVSALTEMNLTNLLSAARAVRKTAMKQIPTPKINQLFERLLAARSAKVLKNKRFKAYYTTQTGNFPYTFRVFCNRATKLEEPYRRYLEKAFIKEFELDGCPIRFDLRGKTVRYPNQDNKR